MKITKSELKEMIREALREELVNRNHLTEAARTTPYTKADFVWDDAAMLDEYQDAILKYLNGADIEDALQDIKTHIIGSGSKWTHGDRGRVYTVESMLHDLDTALYTPGTWGISWVGEDCVCYDNEKEARAEFAKLTVADIPRDCEGIELFYVIDEDGNTETVDVISADDDGYFDESYFK